MVDTTKQLYDQNLQYAEKQETFFKEMDELSAREKQSMTLCKQYKCIAEREQGKVEVMVKEAKQLLASLPESPIAEPIIQEVNLIFPPPQ